MPTVKWHILLLSLLLLCAARPAPAAVIATFHSSQLRSEGFSVRFPHAFVTLKGTRDADGYPIDVAVSFTAARVSPAILAGPVDGVLISDPPKDVARGRRHFSVRLSDAQLAAALATVERYRALGPRSYRLSARNCVDFVADMARAIGLAVRADRALSKKPGAFLDDVRARNPARLL